MTFSSLASCKNYFVKPQPLFVKRIVFFYALLASMQSFGQFDFKGNPKYELRNLARLDSIFGLEKHPDFEFRLHTFGTYPPDVSTFILTVKDSVFKARCFKMQVINDKRYDWVEIEVDASNLKNLWNEILKNRVFSLPDFKELARHKKIDLNFRDGINYTIEYFSGSKKNGALYYHCPVYDGSKLSRGKGITMDVEHNKTCVQLYWKRVETLLVV
jgi:hypothetical protein